MTVILAASLSFSFMYQRESYQSLDEKSQKEKLSVPLAAPSSTPTTNELVFT